jgi:hypothetical protein
MELAAAIGGGGAGGVAAYLLLAHRKIKGYQSPLRWIPALVAGGRVKDLVLVVLVTGAGTAVGVFFGLGMVAALEARAG